jgi:alkanesulfonate monooxygenase SsuD/methylene tetrahydromethanopterin reductase-like flavin-dependent oxidoreductase (luciferase family)
MKHKYWEMIQAMPAAEMTRRIREFEDLGLYGLWVPQLFSPPFATLAAAAMASTKLLIGSGVALAFSRSPVETALNALDLDRISGGRMVLGLGTSIRAFNEDVHGVTYGKPIAHLREVTEIVRTVIEKGHTGELGRFDGTYCKCDLSALNTGRPPVRESIPIWLPALFQNTVDLATKIADGLLGHPVWSLATIAKSVARTEELLAVAGRKRSDFHVNLWNYAAVASDRQTAIDDMRGTVAFYASIKQYEKYFDAHGFGAAARTASDAAARRDNKAMVKAIPDEMVTTFAIAGTPDEALERVTQMAHHADSLTLSPPQYFVPAERLSGYRAAIVNTFYKS